MLKFKFLALAVTIAISVNMTVIAQTSSTKGKPISKDLFGIFFEDLSYAADGGLYAELVQNRSFEYTPADNKVWNPFTAWQYVTDGFGYGSISVESASPLHANNPHYVLLNIQDEGQKGIGLKNTGFDGMVIKPAGQYNFSVFIKNDGKAIPMVVQLQTTKGLVIGEAAFTAGQSAWKKYTATINPTAGTDTAHLVVLAKGKGKLALDMISLFPQNTYKGHANGLRADLGETIADLKPKFMRFPGGCLVHGDGIANIYNWKNTIGPVEQRVEQRNIWNYHQSVGLGYFEYFQFCEDIGAKPLPVVAAAVSCQNSGGTWRIGGTGQKGIPMDEMQAYIQDVIDLIEYANGPATSHWGAMRAAAGHPKPFNLQYIGIGNEDKITPEFTERFTMIYKAVKAKHPEVTIIGTVGPSPAGPDYEAGWKIANQLAVPMVDEHYYENPEWFLKNNHRYDTYNRANSKVYLGEYASRGNTLYNALCEAAYMTALERNGDVVHMASYAPLIARTGHTSWNPNLIYFNGNEVIPTVNYYVQKLFGHNQGDSYFADKVTFSTSNAKDSTLAASCVRDSQTGDIILKIVNTGANAVTANADVSAFKGLASTASLAVLSGDPKAKNTKVDDKNVLPVTSTLKVKPKFTYSVPANSFSVIRISGKK